jgi:hypothetical protein
LPPYSGVIERHINDVEKLILYDDQNYQFTLQFFKEVKGQLYMGFFIDYGFVDILCAIHIL